jgi:hypothetical protein
MSYSRPGAHAVWKSRYAANVSNDRSRVLLLELDVSVARLDRTVVTGVALGMAAAVLPRRQRASAEVAGVRPKASEPRQHERAAGEHAGQRDGH